MLKAITCFNLVIEVLVVSRTVGETQHHSDIVSFNLVIEVLVVSSYGWLSIADFDTTDLFQSRNRGSCRFKVVCRVETRHGETCFNLVIEVLVVSSRRSDTGRSEDNTSFNLVIEVLVVSSTCVAALRKVLVSGFNLVIEVLVVSSVDCGVYPHMHAMFQSRNRGSCRFKSTFPTVTRNAHVVSIS